jgi:hypothetical protein
MMNGHNKVSKREREIICWLLTRYDKRADQIYVPHNIYFTWLM